MFRTLASFNCSASSEIEVKSQLGTGVENKEWSHHQNFLKCFLLQCFFYFYRDFFFYRLSLISFLLTTRYHCHAILHSLSLRHRDDLLLTMQCHDV
jgi:hypothetical protein